ncbi:hypothetical protein I4U23_003603 [Adineta vaga]|nr:hypothetical protein I4U23_003603 [Adineta vaga]
MDPVRTNIREKKPGHLHFYLFLILISCLICSGSIVFVYFHVEHEQASYTNTSCQVLNYTVSKYFSSNCILFHCTMERCFDEQVFVAYRANNKTIDSSILSKSNTYEKYKHLQISNNYTCFHHKQDVELVVFDTPHLSLLSNSLYISILLICLGVAFIIITSICLYFSNIYNCCQYLVLRKTSNKNYNFIPINDLE